MLTLASSLTLVMVDETKTEMRKFTVIKNNRQKNNIMLNQNDVHTLFIFYPYSHFYTLAFTNLHQGSSTSPNLDH